MNSAVLEEIRPSEIEDKDIDYEYELKTWGR